MLTHNVSRNSTAWRTASWLTAALLAVPSLPGQGDGFYGTLPDLSTPRQELATAVLGGVLYAAGGLSGPGTALATVERYDATAGWTPVAPMPTTRHHFGLAAAAGRLFAVGGYVQSFVGNNAVHAYDPAANSWTRVSSLPQPRGALAAVELGGRIYAVGGVHPTRGVVGDLTVYDPATDTWTTLPPMPTPREHLAAAVLDGQLWVCGGRVGFGGELRTVEVFDPATNTWTARPDLPVAHGGTGAAVLRGRLLVFGGEQPAGNVAQVDAWDTGRGAWRRVRDLPLPVHGIYPATLGDRIVVAGGAIVPGYGAVATVQTFAWLPAGVTSVGTSTHCGRPIWLGVAAPPLVGRTGFGWLTSADVPAGALGALVLAGDPAPAGTVLLGAPVFAALGAGTVASAFVADGNGVAFLAGPDPIPAGLTGLSFWLQGVWLPPNGCLPLLASDAITFQVP